MTHRVTFENNVLDVEPGARLRDVLLKAGLSPHNGQSRLINCMGFGTCGTCAVEIDGDVEPPSVRERARLNFPPHKASSGLRLACQVRVHADLTVTKHEGFWGEKDAVRAAPSSG